MVNKALWWAVAVAAGNGSSLLYLPLARAWMAGCSRRRCLRAPWPWCCAAGMQSATGSTSGSWSGTATAGAPPCSV